MNKTIFVVDLDYTLVNTETTSHFLESIGCKKVITVFRPFLFFASILSLLLSKLFGISFDFQKYIKLKLCLNNLSEEQLYSLSYKYVHSVIYKEGFLNRYLFKLLQNLQRKYPIILLTASISPIAKGFSDLGFVIIYSSEIFFRNGKFYRICDLYQRKYMIIKALLNLKGVKEIIIFDDSPEKGIMKLAIQDPRLKLFKVHAKNFIKRQLYKGSDR